MTGLDDRAVSTAVSHALSLGITAIMLTGLMLGASQMIDGQREYVVERGLEDVSSAVVSDMMRMDEFNTTGTSVSFSSDYPDRIGGRPYDVDVHASSTGTTVYLNSSASVEHASVPVRFGNETDVCESSVDGGQLAVAYDPDEQCIELRDG